MSELKATTLPRWIAGTFLGWLLGFLFIVIFAVIGDTIATEEGQGSSTIVGLGMGAGVGIAQWRMASKWFGAKGWWACASMIGLAIPFLVFDLFGSIADSLPEKAHLPIQVLCGGLLAGALQMRALKAKAALWIPASGLAWLLAAGTVALSAITTNLHNSWGAVINLALILFAGVVQGFVTWKSLTWILRK